ncbi:hypothetical protein [Dactylosporangium matsuzakiense]|uniref:Uncharacterized protein n=1 Tax=Dactylosporangium matsuzakiense TaxID=53360 RepID=A0A9W6KTJ3_9ACTN|nr:hypothetical protein [Dactylosporangium matsuzakiense]GLL06930.1 hypothetical protein GCM10017581_086800 [Dactylosporangium matsuzakiense]
MAGAFSGRGNCNSAGSRSYLGELAERFARHLPLPEEPLAAFAAWEAAVGDLVMTATSRTGTDEHWYGNSRLVLRWVLSAAGVPDHLCDAMVAEAIGGRFRSWTRPTGAEVADAAEVLAAAVTGVEPCDDDWPDTWPWDWPGRRSNELPAAARAVPPEVPVPTSDALTAWRRVREAVRWADVAEHVSGPARTGRDGVAAHFAAREDGADGLLAALDLVRADAAAPRPVSSCAASWRHVGRRPGPRSASPARRCSGP